LTFSLCKDEQKVRIFYDKFYGNISHSFLKELN
jgi:hypothetical protein